VSAPLIVLTARRDVYSEVNNELAEAQREVLALRDDNQSLASRHNDMKKAGVVSSNHLNLSDGIIPPACCVRSIVDSPLCAMDHCDGNMRHGV